jgi:glycosyltransferase involved in cell wall biosynthesis
VEFLGPTDDVPRHLATADLVLLPSYREGIPRVAMEAAAMGRAVAGYDVRGMREVIPTSFGLLVPRGETAVLIQLVDGLLDAPEQLVKLGDACHEWVVSKFSEEAVLERLRRVYADFGATA